MVFGGLALAVVPPIITFDGPCHYYRSVQIESGGLRARQFSPNGLGGILPERYPAFVDSLWNRYWTAHDFGSPAAWARASAEAEQRRTKQPVEFTNTAVYSPVNYAFQSLGMGLITLVSRSPLLAHRMGCLFNLAGYLLLIVLAMESLPRFERGFLLFATSPLILVQAASVSADAINFALPTLALALVWRLRIPPPPPTPKRHAVSCGSYWASVWQWPC